MKLYGKNGKMNGLLVLKRLVEDGLIRVADRDMQEQQGRNEILSLTFSDRLYQDPVFSPILSETVEYFLFLFYYAEENSALRLPLSDMPEALAAASGGHAMSGMRFLKLFADGYAAIEAGEHTVEVILKQGLAGEEEQLGRYFKELVRTAARSSGDEDTLPPVFVTSEKASSGTEEDLREEPPITQDVRNTLSRLQQMMQDLDRHTRAERDTEARFRLNYTEGQAYRSERYVLRIPDGYTLKKGADGHEFILYLANPENPAEWEASTFMLTPGVFLADRSADEPVIRKNEEDSACHFTAEIPVSGGVQLFRLTVTAVGKGSEADAEAAAEVLFGGIEASRR